MIQPFDAVIILAVILLIGFFINKLFASNKKLIAQNKAQIKDYNSLYDEWQKLKDQIEKIKNENKTYVERNKRLEAAFAEMTKQKLSWEKKFLDEAKMNDSIREQMYKKGWEAHAEENDMRKYVINILADSKEIFDIHRNGKKN